MRVLDMKMPSAFAYSLDVFCSHNLVGFAVFMLSAFIVL